MGYTTTVVELRIISAGNIRSTVFSGVLASLEIADHIERVRLAFIESGWLNLFDEGFRCDEKGYVWEAESYSLLRLYRLQAVSHKVGASELGEKRHGKQSLTLDS